jgi:hypothetical protein
LILLACVSFFKKENLSVVSSLCFWYMRLSRPSTFDSLLSVFMKCYMDIMPLEVTPSSCFLISYDSNYSIDHASASEVEATVVLQVRQQAVPLSAYFMLIPCLAYSFDSENGPSVLLQNVSWLSTKYTALCCLFRIIFHSGNSGICVLLFTESVKFIYHHHLISDQMYTRGLSRGDRPALQTCVLRAVPQCYLHLLCI